MILIMVATGTPMWWHEYRRAGSSRKPPSRATLPTSTQGLRLRGLLVAALPWLATGLLFEYSGSVATGGFWEAMVLLWPCLLLALWFYLRTQPNPAPLGIEKLGYWLSNRHKQQFPWATMRDQLVKAFFLPLMFAFAYDWTSKTLHLFEESGAMRWYWLPLALLYLVDTSFGTIGYISTSTRLGAQIRSSNPYWIGWLSALVCYPPFFVWLNNIGFNYRDSYEWQHWLGTLYPNAIYYWGSAILVLTAIYAWATIAFGIRFSNLTHRGIITNGPYRYTKHPAYLAKNASWWLISIPFVSKAGGNNALLGCLILIAINTIYWVRAKTEEKHLMQDPEYRAYATWIEHNGIFARLRNLFRA